jgi:hypothetical protein
LQGEKYCIIIESGEQPEISEFCGAAASKRKGSTEVQFNPWVETLAIVEGEFCPSEGAL